MSAEPSACGRKFGVIVTGRNSFGGRLSVRVNVICFYPQRRTKKHPQITQITQKKKHEPTRPQTLAPFLVIGVNLD
jgi:hypothetical protein